MSMSIPPTVTTVQPQKQTDVLPDQVNARVMLGIVDGRAAELYTVAQLFPDYRKGGQNSELDASRPTIDFRFGPVRTTGGDTSQMQEDFAATALTTLKGLLSPNILAFLEDPSSEGTPLYSVLMGTLTILAQTLATAQTAAAPLIEGSTIAGFAQENLLTPYILITTLATDGTSLLNSSFATLSDIPTAEKDQVLNTLNQLTPILGSFNQIVGQLQTGEGNTSDQISALSLQIQKLQGELSSKPDTNLSFVNTFVDQLGSATLALSLGPGPASTFLTQSVVFSQLGKEGSVSGLLNENTLPTINLFAQNLINQFQPELSTGQKALFSLNLATVSLLLLGGKSTLEDLGQKPLNAYMTDNLTKSLLASNLLGSVVGMILDASGLSDSAQKQVGHAVEFALLSSMVYTTNDDKIKEKFFDSVKESLAKLQEAMKEDDAKRRVSSEESQLAPYIEEMSIALKNSNVETFCTACEGILELFNLSKTTITEDLSALKGFASFIFETQQEELETQKSMTATSLRSSA